MGELSFSLNEFVWSMINLIVLGIVIVLPIWFIKKVNSIEKTLKDIRRKLDE